MKRTIAGLTLFTVVVAAGCAAKYDPFRVTPEEFRRRVKTVAVASVAIPPRVAEGAAATPKFHPAIETRLKEAGFAVIPAEQVREIWDTKANELGGLFDQQTGQLNEAKANALIGHVREQVKARFGADALVLPYVRTVVANFNNVLFSVDARWDGASESMLSGTFDKVLPPQVRGTVPALSLFVRIEDLGGSVLYANAGGIQLLQKLAPAGGRFSGENFVSVPQSELLADQARIQQAVSYALQPFFKGER